MKAVVLVGGEGTRMRPLTETIPKPLIPFMNRPFLGHVFDQLARQGIEEVICSSPYLEEEFRSFLEARSGAPSVTWITEEEPLGTAGAVVGALGEVDGTFLVLNGDVLTGLDLGALAAFHRRRGAAATIALHRVDDARPFGLVETDPEGRVLAFREKPAEEIPGTINAGTYVLEPSALDGAPRGVPISIERETFPGLISRGDPVYGFLDGSYWRDLGTPEAYLAAHRDAVARLVGETGPARLPGEIDPSAELDELTVIGAGCLIEKDARVEGSVLHDGASVGARATVVASILGPSSTVEPGARVRGSVLGAGARVRAGAALSGEKVAPLREAG